MQGDHQSAPRGARRAHQRRGERGEHILEHCSPWLASRLQSTLRLQLSEAFVRSYTERRAIWCKQRVRHSLRVPSVRVEAVLISGIWRKFLRRSWRMRRERWATPRLSMRT